MQDFPNRQAAEPSYHRLTASDLEQIAERHVAGESDGAIARSLGYDRSTVRRGRSRPSVVAHVRTLRARERRAQAERDRRCRAKLRKLYGVRTDTPLTPEDVATLPAPLGQGGGAKRGTDYPRIVYEPSRGYLYYPQIGWSRPATRRNFKSLGLNVPEDFRDEWGYGPPGHDRPPLGYVPPSERLVRLRAPAGTREGDLELVRPVPAREAPALDAEGWTRV